HPGSDAGGAEVLVASVDEKLRRRVIELVARHGRMKQTLSICCSKCGRRSETQKPVRRSWWKGNIGPSNCGTPRMKAKRLPSRNACGQSWPFNFTNSGL